MKRIIGVSCFLSLVVSLLCQVSDVNAFSYFDDRLRIHGFLENQTAMRLEDGVNDSGEWSRVRNTMQLEIGADMSESVKFGTILRGYYDAAWDLQNIHQAPKNWDSVPNGIGMRDQFEVREYHVRVYWEDLMIKVGKQQIVWGESDLLRMADIINPLDYSWLINIQSWEDIRIPVRAIDAVWDFGGKYGFKAEAVFVPEDFKTNNFGAPQANWDPTWYVHKNQQPGLGGVQAMWTAQGQQLADLTDNGLDNFQAGMRLRANFGGWDTSLFYYYGLSQDAVQTTNSDIFLGKPVFPMDFHWDRVQNVGATFNYMESYTGTVFRGECAFTIDQPFTNYSNPMLSAMGLPDLEFEESNQFAFMLGFDRPTFIKFLNPTKTFFISGQLFCKYIFDSEDTWVTNLGEYGHDDDQVLATITINTEYWDARILPQIAMVYDFTAEAGILLPKIEYQPTIDTSITLGANILWAGEPTASGIGPFEKNDEVYMQFRLTF